MIDTKQLKQEELEQIQSQSTKSEDEQEYDLESLILNGENIKIPVIIEYPTPKGIIERGAKLKPLTDVEVNNAIRAVRKNKNTTLRIEYLKRGLFTEEDEPFPQELIKKMYTGVIASLSNKLCELSGLPTNNNSNKELIDELLGF